MRALQAAAGNRAVTAALAVQTKLSVGAANDPLEMEADRVARAVSDAVGAGAIEVGRPDRDEETVVARSVAPVIRRAAVGLAGGDLDDETSSALTGELGRGRALESQTRAPMEAAFGADFSAVRVHTGPQSEALNERMGASAFTVGSDIFFRGGQPDVGSGPGRELMAHELTHVVQQGAARRRPEDGEA
ncbi:MAG TPA: DUF4157 domain-containing protein [Acidimicrobiales bacterium]|nr:DUF4157 domain-containing protein [Acidimicrobiales bacterium]